MAADKKWRKASEIYLDKPYLETGFGEYLSVVKDSKQLFPLADLYEALPIDTPKVVRLVEKLGARTKLTIAEANCRANPEWGRLSTVGGERYTSPINQDYVLRYFSLLVPRKSESLAKLVWNTIRSLPNIENDERFFENPLWALYRKNIQGGAHKARSQLVYQLRREAWVPQSGGDFVKPEHARAELLPEGFTFDPGWPWIKAIEFGKNIQIQNERARAEAAAGAERRRKEQEAAKALGFSDAETARKLAEIPPDELATFLSEREHRKQVELPNHEPANPGRRASHVSLGATTAPERRTESRERSVSVARDGVKVETDQYLRHQYTNGDAEQICQICKDILPFKLVNGAHFFEAVELMPDLSRHHYQNYLCLCPNHSAMFRHANCSRKTLRERISEQVDNELEVVLAQQELTIYFTKTHLIDLKSVIAAEQESDEPMEKMISDG